jgi:ATP-dependent DNA ligase
MARRDGNRVRLYTRRGYDWSGKYPRIVEALLSLRVKSIIVDGEAVWVSGRLVSPLVEEGLEEAPMDEGSGFWLR